MILNYLTLISIIQVHLKVTTQVELSNVMFIFIILVTNEFLNVRSIEIIIYIIIISYIY